MNKNRIIRIFDRYSFTLLELLIVIAIIMLLVSMLLPAISKVRQSAQKIVCSNNLMQIGKAFATYSSDYQDYAPVSSQGQRTWEVDRGTAVIADYLNCVGTGIPIGGIALQQRQKFACPVAVNESDPSGSIFTYGYNQIIAYPQWFDSTLSPGWRMSQFKYPTKSMLVSESCESKSISYRYIDSTTTRPVYPYRHNRAQTVLFGDYHVTMMKKDKFPHITSGYQGYSSNAWLSYFWWPAKSDAVMLNIY